ncbi:MAG: chemotaxis protein [Sulfurimonas sp.]|nr:chemotaxis protein [Sulfurimonas sp.]
MTQEELDALMSGDVGDIESLPEEEVAEESVEDTDTEDDITEEELVAPKAADDKPAGYSEKTAHHWPLPATDEHKMVHQLDDVTKESEEKATEIFDIIEGISNDLMENEENENKVMEVLNSNIELFTTLSAKFPDVEAFKTQLEKNSSAQIKVIESLETLQTSGDSIMSVMDIMQYQDIHRQKIERVINVMRALSTYMNSLFEGKIDDDKRVSSAQHLPGDKSGDIASVDDIEALLEQFGA